MTDLLKLGGLLQQEAHFTKLARINGFATVGEIDRFIFHCYGPAVRRVRPADRLNNAIFQLRPGASGETKSSPPAVQNAIAAVRAAQGSTLLSVAADATVTTRSAYSWTAADKKEMSSGGWTRRTAQQISRHLSCCIVWASGVGVVVFLSGDIYLESVDVVEALPAADSSGFQGLSWDDGLILFEFAQLDLSDTSRAGIWRIGDAGVLVPRPEDLIRARLGKFLHSRLAGYKIHEEEGHVEHEGRADISLHLIDDSVFIVEVKWTGCSITASRSKEKDDDIKLERRKASSNWFTRFGDETIRSGVKQLVSYYKTGKFKKAYLAVVDCTVPSKKCAEIAPDVVDLDGHSPASFRVLRAAVDPRSASVRAKVKNA